MEDKEKPGGGGKYQPYIPKGNGGKSGRYCSKAHDDYAHSKHCTEGEMKKLLSTAELRYVRLYSDYHRGTELNKAIRENRMSKFDGIFKDNLINAISKYRLRAPVTVYRLIKVSKDLYVKKSLLNFVYGKPIEGSVICSTSRGFARAVSATHGTDDSLAGIVFEIRFPKGHNALPIESVSADPDEREILISSPKYTIDNIDD